MSYIALGLLVSFVLAVLFSMSFFRYKDKPLEEPEEDLKKEDAVNREAMKRFKKDFIKQKGKPLLVKKVYENDFSIHHCNSVEHSIPLDYPQFINSTFDEPKSESTTEHHNSCDCSSSD